MEKWVIILAITGLKVNWGGKSTQKTVLLGEYFPKYIKDYYFTVT